MKKDKPKKVDVTWHVQVRVPESEVRYVKEWMERFTYLLGDGWGFGQNIAEWITVDGKHVS